MRRVEEYLEANVSRPISLALRLFGNIFAGEVLLFMMAFLVSFVLVVPFYGLELFVGLWAATAQEQYLDFARVLAENLIGGATGHDDKDYRWYQAYRRLRRSGGAATGRRTRMNEGAGISRSGNKPGDRR